MRLDLVLAFSYYAGLRVQTAWMQETDSGRDNTKRNEEVAIRSVILQPPSEAALPAAPVAPIVGPAAVTPMYDPDADSDASAEPVEPKKKKQYKKRGMTSRVKREFDIQPSRVKPSDYGYYNLDRRYHTDQSRSAWTVQQTFLLHLSVILEVQRFQGSHLATKDSERCKFQCMVEMAFKQN